MKIWVDAQLPPGICRWLETELGLEATAVRDLGFRDAADEDIFAAARHADVVVMSKDRDFPELLLRHGPPPRVLWLTCGNTTNRGLRKFLAATLPQGLELLEAGESLVRLAEAA